MDTAKQKGRGVGQPDDVGDYRESLYRFALLQVRDPAAAEDLVQATLLAALQARDGFRGDSSMRTWLIGILKRKIIDHFRAQSREAISLADASATAGDGADEDLLDRLFRNDGSWMSQPGAWDDPERSLEQEGFWVVLEACVQAVPGLAGKAFILRELVGMEADEVCKELTLTRSNYWVLMHRARLRLRQCLDQRWFASEERESRP